MPCWPRSREDTGRARNRDSGRLEHSQVFGWRNPSPQERHLRLLEKAVGDRQRLVTDAKVLQEILKRYSAIDRRDAIQPAFDALPGVVDQVLEIDRSIAERAKQIVLGYRQLSARDAVHLAVMEHHGIERIMTFDSGFDAFPGITPLS
jgi:uncharacterized protein